MTKIYTTRIKIISVIAGVSIACAAVALTPGGPAEMQTISEISAMTSTSIAAISAFGVAFSTSMNLNFQNILSAISVSTKQEAVNGSTMSENMQKSSQVLVSAIKSQNQSNTVVAATFDYAPQTGQGFEPCNTNMRNKSLSDAFSSVEQNLGHEMQSMQVDNKIGSIVNSSSEAMGKRLDKHYANFCTKTEEASGLCTASNLAGADINAAYLFEAAPRNSKVDIARQAYIEHVIGTPDEYPTNGDQNTAQAKSAFMNKINSDALLSIPSYSLQAIRMNNLQQDEYQKQSPNQMLKARVNQYFGGKEANEWVSNIAMQTERGLLVETLKMQGLETWIKQKQYQQNQRLEANLAALVIMDNKQKQEELNNNYQKMMVNN